MIFRHPANEAGKIGRKVEFSNPLRYSNKKHFWAGGVGNYGMLTTQQIEILNQMKKRENRAHLYDMKSVENGFNYSIKELKYGKNARQQKNSNHYQSFEEQNYNIKPEGKEKATIRQPKSKRSASEFRLYDEVDQSYEKFNTIANQETQAGVCRTNKGATLKRRQSGQRRVKTVGIEQIHDLPNPEGKNRIDQMFSELIHPDKPKVQKKHLRIQSGNIRVNHSPQTFKNISKSIENPIPTLQPNIYSERSQKQTQINTTSMNQSSSKNLLESPKQIERKMLMLDKKILTKHKFRRDHSPTFCNSIDYPLKYFRHI